MGILQTLIPSPWYSRGICPHSRSITATIAPITAVNTAVLAPSPSPCQSLILASDSGDEKGRDDAFHTESDGVIKDKMVLPGWGLCSEVPSVSFITVLTLLAG